MIGSIRVKNQITLEDNPIDFFGRLIPLSKGTESSFYHDLKPFFGIERSILDVKENPTSNYTFLRIEIEPAKIILVAEAFSVI